MLLLVGRHPQGRQETPGSCSSPGYSGVRGSHDTHTTVMTRTGSIYYIEAAELRYGNNLEAETMYVAYFDIQQIHQIVIIIQAVILRMGTWSSLGSFDNMTLSSRYE
jgi:hypothetical protein